ncbi:MULTISPECIES: transposase [Streptomyces]|uniref:transposase n=1 Tax=Streptomyces TaxID=1883 RepID=UPI0034371D6F
MEVSWWVQPGIRKQDAVKLVASTGRSINSVAKDLGVNTESLRQWVRAAEAAQAGGGKPAPAVVILRSVATGGSYQPQRDRLRKCCLSQDGKPGPGIGAGGGRSGRRVGGEGGRQHVRL